MKLKYLVITFVLFVFYSCGSSVDLNEIYRLDKKYWNPDDYKNAVQKIGYITNPANKPCYAIPERAPIMQKLVDVQNLKIVLEDEELGLNYRSEFASKIFNQYLKLIDSYQNIDREDKFIYSRELVDILSFGMYLQYQYFSLHNKTVEHDADNPESQRIQNILRDNEKMLISNYCLYLSYIKQEKSFRDNTYNKLLISINEYFPFIIKNLPNADFSELKSKAKAMLNKSNSKNTHKVLNNILQLLNK